MHRVVAVSCILMYMIKMKPDSCNGTIKFVK